MKTSRNTATKISSTLCSILFSPLLFSNQKTIDSNLVELLDNKNQANSRGILMDNSGFVISTAHGLSSNQIPIRQVRINSKNYKNKSKSRLYL